MTHERILLQTIKFDLQVEHPYAYLLKFAKQLKGCPHAPTSHFSSHSVSLQFTVHSVSTHFSSHSVSL